MITPEDRDFSQLSPELERLADAAADYFDVPRVEIDSDGSIVLHPGGALGDPGQGEQSEGLPGLGRATEVTWLGWCLVTLGLVVWAVGGVGSSTNWRSSCGATSGRVRPIGDQVDQLRQSSEHQSR